VSEAQPAIVVLASFPDMVSAIRIHGSQNGARLTIDAPEVSIDDVTTLLRLRGKSFYVAFIATDDAPSRPATATSANDPAPGKSRWIDAPEE
jgi:hypothetical protein